MGVVSRSLLSIVFKTVCGFLGDSNRGGVFGKSFRKYMENMERIDDAVDERTDGTGPAEEDTEGRLAYLNDEAYGLLRNERFSERWHGEIEKLVGKLCQDYRLFCNNSMTNPYELLKLKTNSFVRLLITASAAKAFPEKDHNEQHLETMLDISTTVCELAQIVDDFYDIDSDRHIPHQNIFLCQGIDSGPGFYSVFRSVYSEFNAGVSRMLGRLKQGRHFAYYLACRSMSYLAGLFVNKGILEKVYSAEKV